MDKKIDKKILAGIFLIVLAGLLAYFLLKPPPKTSCLAGYVLKQGECVRKTGPGVGDDTTGEGPKPVVQGSFSEQYSQMSAKWQELGLKESRFHQNYPALKSLTATQLTEIRKALNSFKNQTNSSAIKELSQLYIDLLFLAESQRDLEAKISSFKPATENYCEQLPTLKNFSFKLGEIVERSKSLSQKISSFAAKHSSEAKQINLNPLGSEIFSAEKVFTDQQKAIAVLEQACNG